ncbi:MAG: hypothetical protein U5J83_13635 [Bryobacterales bacterium]|nr:hypothetical protein [Bryobacterales bacterium]
MEHEDPAALLYLQHRIFGFEDRMSIKYLAIDEAQDYSRFQMLPSRRFFPPGCSPFWGIWRSEHHRGIRDWQELMETVSGDDCRYLTLEQSYRTTVEIMEVANHVLQLGWIFRD